MVLAQFFGALSFLRNSNFAKENFMSRDIDSCFREFEQMKQLALLDQPCRTVVTVYSAWGVIENGGAAVFL